MTEKEIENLKVDNRRLMLSLNEKMSHIEQLEFIIQDKTDFLKQVRDSGAKNIQINFQ